MKKRNTWWKLLLRLLLIISMTMVVENTLADSSAVNSLLNDAKTYYEGEEYEQAAVSLERALRIEPRHPILWHNLAGVRLAQQDWIRAFNLALKSNALVGNEENYKDLRIRNWVVITQACEGMGDEECAKDARERAQALVQRLE